jgi:ADP-ribosylglycohydrolase
VRIEDVRYSPNPKEELDEYVDNLMRYSRLAAEFGQPTEGDAIIEAARKALQDGLKAFDQLVQNAPADGDEPETLEEIQARRPEGVRRLVNAVPADYLERWRGSFLGRGAGCTLGAQVEFWSVDQMENWARQFGEVYPPTDYFPYARTPERPRYKVGNDSFGIRTHRGFIPVDDDTDYSVIGLLTLEEHGEDFTKEQQAATWVRNYLPVRVENGSYGSYWGERNMLLNLQKGIPADRAGYAGNANVQSIAAWTRADTWGYVAPGWPEKAAELAYKDASINHRRNGVYGTMFFAATIAASFVVGTTEEALHIGLQEIPKDSLFAEAIRWAFEVAPRVRNFRDAAELVNERYGEMFEGHAINNGLYVTFGLLLGGRVFTKVIGETVAMGFDNDCTGATAGSIVGAVLGEHRVPTHWTDRFENTLQSYLNDTPEFIDLDHLGQRYLAQAKTLAAAGSASQSSEVSMMAEQVH